MKTSPLSGLLSGLLLLSLGLTAACGSGAAENAADARYPEQRRPPPLRSASDGEVMGADQQTPEDRLEASPTNEHAAHGWEVENGTLVPQREARRREAATKAAEENCDPNAPESASAQKASTNSDATPPKKPRCPKPTAR
jgi:hypothetical protein